MKDYEKTMKKSPQITVLVTGVFDILHQEHRNFLQKAQALGDRLVVGIESDVRVRELKGPDRPINSQKARVFALEKLRLADEVFVLPEQFSKEEDHFALLEKMKPNILAVSESSPHIDKKEKLMERVGGKVVVVHTHNHAISTTQILEAEKHRSVK